MRLRRVLFLLAITAVWVHAAPKAEIDPTEIDLGSIKPGTLTERTIAIKNTGDVPLEIVKVQSSCPCAIVEMPPAGDATIKPGGVYELPLTYDPKDRVGPQQASIVIETNDPDEPVQIVELTVFIEVLVMVRPPTGLAWGMSVHGAAINKTIVIAPGDPAKDIALLDVRSLDPNLLVTSEKITKGEQRYFELKFSTKPSAPLGSIDTSLEARVQIGNEIAELSIPARGEVIGDLLVSPPAIISPKTAYAQGQRISEITVRASQGKTPPDLLGAMAVGPLRATIMKNAEPDAHKIEVAAADNVSAGPQSGTIYVMTDSVDEPVVAVPVYFLAGAPVTATPESAALDAGKSQRIEVRRANPGVVNITNLGFETDVIAAKVDTATGEGGKPAVVSIQAAGGLNPNKLTTILVIETDVPGAARVYVPVVVRK